MTIVINKKHLVAVWSFVSIAALLLATFMGFDVVSAAVPYVNTRVNVDSSGNQANNSTAGNSNVSTSSDGRYTVFSSHATNLVSGDTNGKADIFVKDKVTGGIELVSVSTAGVQANADVLDAKISGNGRVVVFSSIATTLVSGAGGNNKFHIFVRDLDTDTTEVVSVSSSGVIANGTSGQGGYLFDINYDGRYVAFASAATNLVIGDTNGQMDVFVRDRKLSNTIRVSESIAGMQADNRSTAVAISCEGSKVAFVSEATNIVPGDTNGVQDIFLLDRLGYTLENITILGDAANYNAFDVYGIDISCTGNKVSFTSRATNLTALGTTTNRDHVFVYDHSTDSMELVSQKDTATEPNGNSRYSYISDDGRFIIFQTWATDLVSDGYGGGIFMRDIKQGVSERISMRNATTPITSISEGKTISGDARYVFFVSNDGLIVSGDTNGYEDVFRAETGVNPCSI